MRIKPFTALGFQWETSRGISKEEQVLVMSTFLDGLARVSPELRCAGNPLSPNEKATSRTDITDLTEAECEGDIPDISFVARDRDGKIVGAFLLYAVNTVSSSRTELVVQARPMPAFNHLDDQDYANFLLDMMEFLLRNDFTLDDGRTLKFEAMELSLFFKTVGDRDRDARDERVELAERELTRRKTRGSEPLQVTTTTDEIGRQRHRVLKPVSS